MGQFKAYWMTDIPIARFAEVANTTLRRFGWESIFVNDDMGTITGNLNRAENVMGKTWHYKYRIILRWIETPEAAPIMKSLPERSICHMRDGMMIPIDRNTQWSERELVKYRDGCVVEVDVNEDGYSWTDNECLKKFQQIVEGAWHDSRRLVEKAAQGSAKGARWATGEELQEQGYIDNQTGDRSLIISADNSAGVFFRLPEPDTNRHALVCGPTGTGKTTGIFVPNLIERTGVSAIVTEATASKGRADLYQKTAGYRAASGHAIYYFNPDDLRSDRINPLDRVHTYRDARRITEIIMQSTTLQTHRGDQTWDMAERLLLTSLILHVVGEREEGNCNLGFILRLLNKGAEGLESILSGSNIEEAREAYQGFLNNSTEAYRNLVAGGLITRLELWKDPRIKALTETTDIDFDGLSEQLFTWYLATPADKPELKPLAALIFNIALDVVGQCNFKHGVALFLDEFTNFGFVRGMPQKLSIIRHDKIPCVLGIQDYIQLELLYQKEAPLFLSQPGTRIFLRPNDQQTAERISKGLGIVEQTRRKVTSSGQIHEEKDRYPLLSLDELLNLDSNELVAFTPKTRPIKTKALSWQDYVKQTDENEFPPPSRRTLQVEEGLTRRDGTKTTPPKKPAPAAAKTKDKQPEPKIQKPAVPSNPLAWAKEIRIEWPKDSGYDTNVYSPNSPLDKLELLAFAYENNDPDAKRAMSESDYQRVCAWIEARETTEVIDVLPDEEPADQPDEEDEEDSTNQDVIPAHATEDKQQRQKPEVETERLEEDDFMGAWG